ncbi:heme-binding protein [Novosphingobium sp.]|uniref:GlcG/HbpS family heme-binding protein n=1 Tax=Novosphingobium sp. TaxID=1874826 RepID=UPI0031D3D948
MPLTFKTATLQDAQAILSAAISTAEAVGVKAAIVILDATGDILLAARMDGAWAGAFDLALAKANVSRGFAAPSGYFAPLVQPGAPLYGVGSVQSGKYLPLPGGMPVTSPDGLLGAIGVSGGTPDQDTAIAQAGAATLAAG